MDVGSSPAIDRPVDGHEALKAERDRLLEIVTALGVVSSSPGSTQVLMDDTVAQVQKLTRSQGAVLELVDGNELVYRAASGSVAGHVGMRLKVATSLSGLSVAQKQVIYSQDTDVDTRVDIEACRKIGARSMLVVPLRRGTKAVGVLKAVSVRPGAFDAMDEYALSIFAQFIGGVLARQAERDGSAQVAATMERRALSDELTQLPNRAAWQIALEQAIARARRSRNPLAVMYLDLNGFKAVNDQHGHAAGDAVLSGFASQLRSCIRTSDFVARLGGDEFAILIEGVSEIDRDLSLVANKVVNAARAGIRWKDRVLVCMPSVGVAYQTRTDCDAETLMRVADKAMYRAKKGGVPFAMLDCADA